MRSVFWLVIFLLIGLNSSELDICSDARNMLENYLNELASVRFAFHGAFVSLGIVSYEAKKAMDATSRSFNSQWDNCRFPSTAFWLPMRVISLMKAGGKRPYIQNFHRVLKLRGLWFPQSS